jgi:hypothetical protein
MIEIADEFARSGLSYPNYLTQLGAEAQTEILAKSSIDLAMRDGFRKMRGFLMTTKGLTEDRPRMRRSR